MYKSIAWASFCMLLLSTVFLAHNSYAQFVVVPNTVALYYDVEWGTNCLPDVSSFPVYRTIYVVTHFVDCTGGIDAWEMSFAATPNISLIFVSIQGSYVNIGLFPNFAVGLAQPLACGEATVIATLGLYATGAGSVSIEPAYPPSIPGSAFPAFVCHGSQEIHDLTPLNGGNGRPSLTIGPVGCPEGNVFGGGGVVETTRLTWSSIKGLFRS